MADNNLLKEYEQVQNSSKTNPYEDELARYLNEENYKDYFNTIIQAYNRNQLTQKQLQNNLAASGFGSQGYGASMVASANNDLLNEYANAQNNYNSNKNDIAIDSYNRYQENQANKLNGLISFIQNSSNKEELDTYLKNYGMLNEDGSYNFNGLTDSQAANLKSQIDFAMNNFANTEKALLETYIQNDPTVYTSVDSLLNATVGGSGSGSGQKLADSGIASGIKNMFSQISSGNVADGTVFYIQTNNQGDGADWGQYFVYLNGNVYRLHEMAPQGYTGKIVNITSGLNPDNDEVRNERTETIEGVYNPGGTNKEFEDVIKDKEKVDFSNPNYPRANELKNKINQLYNGEEPINGDQITLENHMYTYTYMYYNGNWYRLM